MPNISDYDAGNLGLRPSETGVESYAAAGRRIGASYNQEAQGLETAGARIGQSIREAGDTAVDYIDHQQINAGADHGATVRAALQDSWNQTSAGADPHDPSVAKKWREEQLEPTLEQFSSGFTTEKSQDWANHFVNETRQEFYNKSEADMSSLAKDAVVKTVSNLGNRLSNMAVSDPSSVGASLAMVDHSIDGILGANPNIKGADAGRVKLEVGEKIKEQIIKGGAYGAISNAADPEAAASAWAAKYPDYINGPEELALAKAAKVQARSNVALEKQTQLYQKQIDTLDVDSARNKIWADNVTIGPDGKPQIKPDFFNAAVKLPMQYPNAPNATETAKTLLDWGEHQQKPGKVATDPATISDLDTRMFAADNPTTTLQLLRAEADGKVSHDDAAIRRQLITQRDQEPIKDPMFKYAMDAAKDQIVSTLPGLGKQGSDKYAGFMSTFMPQYMRMSREGTLPPNALDINDPESLISKSIAPYRSPLHQVISANGGVGSTGVTPTPSATPGVSATPPVSLPAIKERVKGNIYQTPRGQMEWTGTGWRQPAGT